MNLFRPFAATLVALLLTAAAASAATITATLVEDGPDLVLGVTGSVDTTGLGTPSNQWAASVAQIEESGFGIRNSATDTYAIAITGPAFATGYVFTTDVSGSTFYISPDFLDLPIGYVSGDPIAGTARFAGTTLAAIGATAGLYVYTIGDTTVSLTVGALPPVAEVPLPAGGFLLLVAIGTLVRRRPV